jgi:hypothetical protein
VSNEVPKERTAATIVPFKSRVKKNLRKNPDGHPPLPYPLQGDSIKNGEEAGTAPKSPGDH